MEDYRPARSTKDPVEVTSDPLFVGKLSELVRQFSGCNDMIITLILANGQGDVSMISNLADASVINELLEKAKTGEPGVTVTGAQLQ